MYDIACTFDKYLKARIDQDVYKRMTFSVSIFHMYGHEYKCRNLYSPRKTSGIGLTDGEGSERNWSKSRYPPFRSECSIERHMVPSIRPSSVPARRQHLTSVFFAMGEMQRLHYSNALPRRLLNARLVVQKSWDDLQKLLAKTGLLREELEEQAASMHKYYSTYEDQLNSIHYEDDICELLMCKEAIMVELSKWLGSDAPPPGPNYEYRLRQSIAAIVKGRIPPDQLHADKMEEKLEDLLDRAGLKYTDWIDENGKSTERYIKARHRYSYRELKILKSQMFTVWMNYKYELEALHHIVKGTYPILNYSDREVAKQPNK